MPRRYADYLAADGFTSVSIPTPLGYGRSPEWATSCPPPRHNFVPLSRIRSESPAFDLRHPEIAVLELDGSAR
ncbi:hypothetical protein BIV25_09800 [Streptomyces sp. MUSC 14]|nr:hypothetical protein BIV25_09800 [Streptomyces sp. MUSC 14]